ncbi:two-component regulator propeller domain-containing protein [Rubellicoccus peritrichatus]|uniref:histidine kinase n=1 Tax=Rubellicoccus peritrichatus TaxID=3080537 RepID=A0AAQ3L7E0_9BACT|nr:two-component regulator propeller domain-containing protein [Puniceicoccus sp. CR14]WOO40979.1 two-component regulator propeller domain-containing protein [Puniceicoccus sp. CR14]
MIKLLLVGSLPWQNTSHAFNVLPTAEGSPVGNRNVHEEWGVRDGLPSRAVLSIAQSSDGYLWLGTYHGLVRFDGVDFKVFMANTIPGLHNSGVWSLLAHSDGSLWIGTNGGGISVYKNGQFSSISTAKGLPNTVVLSLAEGPDNEVWAGTRFGAAKIKDRDVTGVFPDNGLPGREVYAVAVASDGNVWMGTNEGLARLENEVVKIPDSVGSLAGVSVQALHFDHGDCLWIATQEDGVWVLDGEELKRPHFWDEVESNNWHAIAEDANGTVWVGGDNGLVAFNKFGAQKFEMDEEHKDVSIRSLLFGREDGLWIGTYSDGLHRLKRGKFDMVDLDDEPLETQIFSVAQDGNNYWVAGKGGLWLLNKTKEPRFWGLKDGLPGAELRAVAVDDDGNVWVGEFNNGIARWDGEKFTVFTEADGLPSNRVRAIYVDSSGRVLIGTQEGLAVIVDDEIITLASEHSLLAHTILFIEETPDGILWVGTNGSGAVMYANGEWKGITPEDGLPSGLVFDVYHDGPNATWLATGNGLARLRNGKIDVVTSRHGLPGEPVFFMLKDRYERVWIGSNIGLYSIDQSGLDSVANGEVVDLRPHLFSEDDGMRTREVSAPSVALTDSDGKMWIPTLAGIVQVDPDKMEVNQNPPPVFVDSVEPESDKIESGVVIFPTGVRDISFNFAVPSLSNPEELRVQAMLEGYDEEWREMGNRREINYEDLSPGDYTFRVRAANDDGVWNLKGASYAFRLPHRFYEHPLFWLLCVLLLALVVYLVHRARMLTLKRRQDKLEQLIEQKTHAINEALEKAEAANDAKTQFLANMSHELNTPLNGVLGYASLIGDTELDDDQEDSLEQLVKCSEMLRALINDVLDLAKIEAGKLSLHYERFDLHELLTDAANLFLMEAKTKNLDFELQIADSVPKEVEGDPIRLRQIIFNLLSNAVKFTPAGNVSFSISAAHEIVTFKVKDTGIGIPIEAREKLFAPFSQADDSSTRRFGGTGLGLSICRRLAHAMKGSIAYSSEVGKGTTFRVKLPLKTATGEDTLQGALSK